MNETARSSWWQGLWPGAERVDTPTATVLLHGDWAYKVKKPVHLPFLDFSTLARRRRFLEEELRLNRRTAPGLYLDVLPLTGSPEAPVLGGAGQPWEWVLRMRRFPPGALLAELAQTGALTAAHLDAVAEHIAAFHQAQTPLPPDPGAKDVAAWARESLDELAQHPGWPPAVATHLAAGRAWLAGPCAAQSAWRAERAAQGWVREVHGDLHLGNLVWWRGQAVAFDALEFDPALRRIDVCNDMAFTFMDLCVQAGPAWAWRFVGAYLERTGDYAGLRGLPVYAVYRAWVRAKVAWLGGDGARCERYAAGAERLAKPAPQPRVCLMMGLSGSGKSTLAAALVQALAEAGWPAVRVRADVERKRLFGLCATDRPGTAGVSVERLYGPEAHRQTYDRLLELAAVVTGAGCSVVLDAASLRQAERARFRDWAQAQGLAFTLVECVAPPEAQERRLQQRAQDQSDASDADAVVLAQQRRWAEPVPPDWAPCHRVVHNGGGLDDLQAQARAWVATWRA